MRLCEFTCVFYANFNAVLAFRVLLYLTDMSCKDNKHQDVEYALYSVIVSIHIDIHDQYLCEHSFCYNRTNIECTYHRYQYIADRLYVLSVCT